MRFINPVSGCSRTQLAAVFTGDLARGSHLNTCRGCSICHILWIVIFFQVSITVSECLVNSLIQILLFNALLNVLIAACSSNCVGFSSFGGVNCVLCGSQHELGQLNEAGAV